MVLCMDKKDLAFFLDCANHHPDATSQDIRKLCAVVLKYGFHSAFVNPCYVPLAKKLVGKKASVGTVVSFPLGQDTLAAKIAAAVDAAKNGADELDVSMNVGMFKEKRYSLVREGMTRIVKAVKKTRKNTLVKFIIETGYLTSKEIQVASRLVVASGADFVKTCSGLGPRGASLKDVTLIKKAIGNKALIKVAGGISTTEQAIAFVRAGAHRIGTSHAVEIVKGVSSKYENGGKE